MKINHRCLPLAICNNAYLKPSLCVLFYRITLRLLWKGLSTGEWTRSKLFYKHCWSAICFVLIGLQSRYSHFSPLLLKEQLMLKPSIKVHFSIRILCLKTNTNVLQCFYSSWPIRVRKSKPTGKQFHCAFVMTYEKDHAYNNSSQKRSADSTNTSFKISE